MSIRNGQLRISRYWQIDPDKQTTYNHPAAYVEHFRSLFDEVVKCRMRSAFPVGVLVSGGLDSSAITAIAASHGRSVEGFTSFDQASPRADERPYAQQLCQAVGIPLWEFSGSCRDPLLGLDELLFQVESPMVGTDRNALEFSALMQSRNCRIALDGDGGDQLLDEFGYLADLLRRASPARFVRETRRFADWYGEPFREFAMIALTEASPHALKVWGKHLVRGIPPPWINKTLARAVDWQARINQPRVPLPFPWLCQRDAYVHTLGAYTTFRLELVERDAAYAGREAWHPFFDSRLIEFIVSIPWHQRCHDGRRKWLLREALRDRLPDIILHRKGKGDWTSNMHEAVTMLCRREPPEPLANRSGMMQRYVDFRGVGHLVNRYLRGRSRLGWDLWSCVALDRWFGAFWKQGEQPYATAIQAVSQEAVHSTEVARVW